MAYLNTRNKWEKYKVLVCSEQTDFQKSVCVFFKKLFGIWTVEYIILHQLLHVESSVYCWLVCCVFIQMTTCVPVWRRWFVIELSVC